MLNSFIVALCKAILYFSKLLNLGAGSTWPGHIALNLDKNFIKHFINKNPNIKIILVAGTNGKTTTSKLIIHILKQEGLRVFHNQSGANLLNGISSTLIQYSNLKGKIDYDYAVFEVDENTLPFALKEFTPHNLIILNLFRDQLDRYGEVNSIAQKWQKAINNLSQKTKLILNADDPQVAYLGNTFKNVMYFGIQKPYGYVSIHHNIQDSIYCPSCNVRLDFKEVYFSHLGDWMCRKCGLKRPEANVFCSETYPLSGIYNQYNVHAAILFAKINNIKNKTIQQSLLDFKPAFGRQEEIEINKKRVKIFLSKNPTSFNESLKTISELNAKNLLIVLNDRIPDGRDVSWIWDVNTEMLNDFNGLIYVSGDRVYDISLRLKYSFQDQRSKHKVQNQNLKFKAFENLKEAISNALENLPSDEILYVLPTYSAMLEVRKILTGKRIL